MDEVLIVRGVKDFDDLKRFGLPMANRVAESDIVIAIDASGNATAIKSREQMRIDFVDSDSKLGEISSIIGLIKDAYTQTHRDDARLAHAFVGMWLFYWVGGFGEEISPLPIEMIAAGDIERLRKSAQQYIDADFGNRADMISADGGSDQTPA